MAGRAAQDTGQEILTLYSYVSEVTEELRLRKKDSG